MKIKELAQEMNLSTLKFIIFTSITMNLFIVIWHERYMDKLGDIMGKINVFNYFKTAIIFSIGLYYVLLSATGTFYANVINAIIANDNSARSFLDMGNATYALSGLFVFAFWILNIIWSFKAIDNIQEYVVDNELSEIQFNKFLVFLCNVYYVNYKINQIAKIEENR